MLTKVPFSGSIQGFIYIIYIFLIFFFFVLRNTLTSQEMMDFLNSNAVIFWSCAVETGEGRRVVHALHAKTYPFIGVIILRDNVMTLVAR